MIINDSYAIFFAGPEDLYALLFVGSMALGTYLGRCWELSGKKTAIPASIFSYISRPQKPKPLTAEHTIAVIADQREKDQKEHAIFRTDMETLILKQEGCSKDIKEVGKQIQDDQRVLERATEITQKLERVEQENRELKQQLQKAREEKQILVGQFQTFAEQAERKVKANNNEIQLLKKTISELEEKLKTQ